MKLKPVLKSHVKFVQVRPYDVGGYIITNECIKTHRSLVQNLTFKRVAAICAGGEVGLTVYGPRCEELILIDHGTVGLQAAYLKLEMLRKLKTGTFQKIITGGMPEQIVPHIKKLVSSLPDELYPHGSIDLKAGIPMGSALIKDAWDDQPRLKALKKLLPKISLVHGDIRDLNTMGTFDLIYGSNAIVDHRGHDYHIPQATDLLPCLNPGGHLILTGYTNRPVDPGFTQVAHTQYGWWDYYVWQKN